MAVTLRLTEDEDEGETLTRLARSVRLSKNHAAATAIDLVAPKRDHAEFVAASTERLLTRYSSLLGRLAQA